MPDIDDVYDSDEEREELANILERRYLAMLNAVHATLVQLFGLDPERFRLPDSATNAVLVEAAQRVVRIDETTRWAIAEQLRIGQALGLSTYDIAYGNPEIGYRGIDGLYKETWKNRALTIARTELQHAQNEASLNRYAASTMIDFVEIRDGDYDGPCAARNGKIVPISEHPTLNHPNCLPAGEFVLAPNKLASSVRWYDGEVVVLRTAADDSLTATPNHPVLSSRGFVSVGSLRHGDHVVRCCNVQRVAQLIDPDHDDPPTMIEQIANASRPSRQSTSATVPLTAVDFHGDVTADGDVCVVRTDGCANADWQRRVRGNLAQKISELAVVDADTMLAPQPGTGTSLKTFQRIAIPAPSVMRRGSIGGSFGRCSAGLAQRGGFGHGARPAMVAQPLSNSGGRYADQLSDLYRTHLLDDVEVVEIRRLPFRGHVYNLQTKQGWYIAQNIVTHNCTLNVIPILREGIV